MAAKYRGKHEGKTRGKYVKAMLRHTFKENRDWFQACRNIGAHLSEMGVHITRCERKNNTYDEYVEVIHLAGASVGLEGLSYHENRGDGFPQHRIDMKIVSNDSIDDVVEKIESRLSESRTSYSFEHLDSSRYF